MNVLRIDLIKEIGNVKTYKIIYEESESIETRLVGNTFNYDEKKKRKVSSVYEF